MNMKRKSSTEKLLMSFSDFPIFISIIWKLFQDRASLNTRSSLMPLNADIAPPDDSPSMLASLSTISTVLMMTMTQSNRLNLSRTYSFAPRPISLMIISAKKHTDITSFTNSTR